ncbi:hypothetical protein [Flavobacterium phycosphaerae]|uniref:hypothetical protein n=1 Tax=Flavobacterium phycosphaerae TaxID=2697515 RepID=UPI001389A316|nr:hypothetical protein [Flavobacterium phycosphaerae]
MKSSEVKFQNHFKLDVPFKDIIIFESELEKYGIQYYYEENEPFISDGVKYFLLDSDREKIDQLLLRNDLIASTETIHVSDYREERKIQKLYLKTLLIAVLIILIVSIIVSL